MKDYRIGLIVFMVGLALLLANVAIAFWRG